MALALEEAQQAFNEGEVPVGAVLVTPDGRVHFRAHNRRESKADPTAHAELLALREGAMLNGQWRLEGYTLYVTKEPCIMCAGAMVNARLKRVVYACRDIKAGGAETLYQILSDPRLNHRVEVTGGVLEAEGRRLLQYFFRERRNNGSAEK